MTFIATLIAIAAVTGYLFDLAAIPVAWLLGPMLVGIAAAGLNRAPRPLHGNYMTFAQIVIGIATGVSFPLATLKAAAVHAVPLVLAVLITGGLSLLNGYLLWRWAGIDRATGFMGSLPGAASTMVAMADEMGADGVVVAILQYLRLLLVVFLAPVAVHYLFPAGAGSHAATGAGALPDAPAAVGWLLLLLAAVAGAWGGKRLRLPAPTFLGPFLATLVIAWSIPWQLHVPGWLFQAGMLAAGLAIGVRFDVPLARKLGRAALIETILVVALIGICLIVGYGFHVLTGIDPLTAVLGSTPGGMDVMVASAVELGGDAGLVLAMQMTRWLVVLLAGPWVAIRLGRQVPATGQEM